MVLCGEGLVSTQTFLRMDVIVKFSVYLLFLATAAALNNSVINPCDIDEFRDINNKEPITNIDQECKGKKCIAKCCSKLDRLLLNIKNNASTICISKEQLKESGVNISNLDYTVQVFEGERDVKPVNRNLTEYHAVRNAKIGKNECRDKTYQTHDDGYYLYKNNSLITVRDNYYHRFWNNYDFGDFCYEHRVVLEKDGRIQEPKLVFYLLARHTEKQIQQDTTYKSVLMILSCVCLVLVFIQYCWMFTVERWKMSTMIILAYVAMFFGTFLLRVAMDLSEPTGAQCKPISALLYYLVLSTFFWMTVMSLDIWRTCRGKHLPQRIDKKKASRKFMWYGVYAWGVPMIIAGAVIYIDYADLSDQPYIYKPHFEKCFYLSDEDGVIEMRHYLYMPLAALLGVCTIFFLMTTYNIWRVKHGLKLGDSNVNSTHSYRFWLYFKLSVVMGISWLLETIRLPAWLETIADVYNCSTGVAIFIIFTCKRKVILKLCKRLKIENSCVAKLSPKSSTATTTTTSDRKKSENENTGFSAVPTTDTQNNRIST